MGARKARCLSCKKKRRYENLPTNRILNPPLCSICQLQIKVNNMFFLLEWHRFLGNGNGDEIDSGYKLCATEEDAYKFACGLILDDGEDDPYPENKSSFLKIQELISSSNFVEAVDEYRNNIGAMTFYIHEMKVETHPGFTNI